ncbi:hypothetical protein RhiirA1_445859 [Rhizophagus irregularis]|uniref:Uncharacterized protein n=2 Tax=Rhizophagus irregularis TaxID=588596 RepID=A0A2N0R4R4_9GLOM|nr:hypothetical protein RhiirA1_445859 [Rhizophagus irregularis]
MVYIKRKRLTCRTSWALWSNVPSSMIDSIQEFPSIADNVNIGRHTSSIRKAKITRMVLTPPLTLDQLVRLLEKDQLEPDDDDDKRTIGNMYGFIPTLMEYPKREARLHLKEPEDNKLLPHLKTINVVVKKLNQTEFPSQPIFLQKMLNDLRRLNLLNYIKKNLEVNIREFDGNELTLNPPIQPGDL